MHTTMLRHLIGATLATVVVAHLGWAGLIGSPARAAVSPAGLPTVGASPLDDPFYDYDGTTPLGRIKLGTPLKTREVAYSVQGLALPLTATQVLYRTENAVGDAVVNVTTVVRPLSLPGATHDKVVSYQSFYDSLNPADQPSAAIAGGSGLGNAIVNVETALIAPLMLAGYAVNIPDTEGQTADFAAGPEYGRTTLDSLRAISRTDATGVAGDARIGLIGYSGGAIASEWAAELASTYAPGVSRRIVGTAIGGVLVNPARNLHYVEGSQIWAGVMPMALVGLARGYQVDLARYANSYGRQVMASMEKASISEVLGAYPGLTWADLARPRFAQPESIPAYVDVANQLIMSTGGTPAAPMFIGQGTGGEQEGTAGTKPGIGAGDGVMVAGDVRTLARRYCQRGVAVQYAEYPLSHVGSAAVWLPQAYPWLLSRFAGAAPSSSCGSIEKGNPLRPLPRP